MSTGSTSGGDNVNASTEGTEPQAHTSPSPENPAPDNLGAENLSASGTPANNPGAESSSAPNVSGPNVSGPNASGPNSSGEAASGATNPSAQSAAPLSKVARGGGPLAARGIGVAKPASPVVSTETLEKEEAAKAGKSGKPKGGKNSPRPRLAGDKPGKPQRPQPKITKVAVPNVRDALADDIQAELDAELAAADIDSMLGGSAGMPDRKEPLDDGARVHGQVLKIHDDTVFVALGGPDEGSMPFEQFEKEPEIGAQIEVVVRGMNKEDCLYVLSLPGGTVNVTDWEDIEEGSVVEATVTGTNNGGLECKVGGVKAFMPISQISEYRIEDTSEFVDKRLRCVVTEANMGRGNLVLSHRAVLEREREEKRKAQMEQIQAGDEMEGVVRSIKDFGAFVDLGGVDGLIHISKLSWDRVKHPSEVLEVGQKVQVKIDTLDKDTGKVGLSYRDLLENPWDAAEVEYAVSTVHKGTVTKLAVFGCFVKLAQGIEGLVHISELAHHRVSKVDSVVTEGQEVEVKVLSFDRDTQKIGLSIKAAQQAAMPAASSEPEVEEPQREVEVKATHTGPLKGGNNTDTGGEKFGLRW